MESWSCKWTINVSWIQLLCAPPVSAQRRGICFYFIIALTESTDEPRQCRREKERERRQWRGGGRKKGRKAREETVVREHKPNRKLNVFSFSFFSSFIRKFECNGLNFCTTFFSFGIRVHTEPALQRRRRHRKFTKLFDICLLCARLFSFFISFFFSFHFFFVFCMCTGTTPCVYSRIRGCWLNLPKTQATGSIFGRFFFWATVETVTIHESWCIVRRVSVCNFATHSKVAAFFSFNRMQILCIIGMNFINWNAISFAVFFPSISLPLSVPVKRFVDRIATFVHENRKW